MSFVGLGDAVNSKQGFRSAWPQAGQSFACLSDNRSISGSSRLDLLGTEYISAHQSYGFRLPLTCIVMLIDSWQTHPHPVRLYDVFVIIYRPLRRRCWYLRLALIRACCAHRFFSFRFGSFLT
jgi:hypothetical protein